MNFKPADRDTIHITTQTIDALVQQSENITKDPVTPAERKTIQKLSEEPDKQDKILVKDLSGFRSIYSAGRYRILYKIEKKTVIVYVMAVGIRKESESHS